MNDTSNAPSQNVSQGKTPEMAKPRGADILDKIILAKEESLAQAKQECSLKDMVSKAQAQSVTPLGFSRALKEKAADKTVGLIAELKKASPSGGVIRADYEPDKIAASYERGGATCLSVLTEDKYFGGSNDDLQLVKKVSALPVLRKDFIIDPWQIYESRVIGADCILLILSILDDDKANELVEHAKGLDMDVLVEIHDQKELQRALALDTFIIGINNRNLKTLETDINVSKTLVSQVPPDRIVVSESGIKTHTEVAKLSKEGVTGFLVGESLLRQPDPGVAARALLGL